MFNKIRYRLPDRRRFQSTTGSRKKRKDATIDLQERALRLISMNPKGILQTELRMILGIDSNKCYKVVSRLEIKGHISRERPPEKSSRTYLIKMASGQARGRKSADGCDHRGGKAQKKGDDLASKSCKDDFLRRNIDSYLTEIYLLYLIRGAAK